MSFFNQHIPHALPYQNTWDIRQTVPLMPCVWIVHQTGYKVNLFASSVVVGTPAAMEHHMHRSSLGKTFRGVATAPRIFIESNYASGSRNPDGHTWGTFDQIYPSNHDKLEFADQFGRKNIQQVRAGVEETIGKKWKLQQTYEDLWVATTHAALYTSKGAITIPAGPKATSGHIGQEVDLVAEHQPGRVKHLRKDSESTWTKQLKTIELPGEACSTPVRQL
jgi:hypothetical protein